MTIDMNNLFDPHSKEWEHNLYEYYDELRSNHPVYWSEKFDTWVLTRYADVAMVLGDDDNFSTQKRGVLLFDVGPDGGKSRLGSTMGTLDGAAHTSIRQPMEPLFKKPIIEKYDDIISAIMVKVLDNISRTGQIDMEREIAIPISAEVVMGILDWPVPELGVSKEELISYFDELIMKAPFRDYDPNYNYKKVDPMNTPGVTPLMNYLNRVIQFKKANPADDMISILQRTDRSLCPSPEMIPLIIPWVNIVIVTNDLLVSTLKMLWRNMALFPQVVDEIRNDRSLIPAFIEETLRYDSPSQRAKRTSLRDFTIHGVTIKEGELVTACTGSANRDPEIFLNPEQFDIHRDWSKHLSFSLGKHNCVGATLTRRVCIQVLNEFFNRYKSVSICDDSYPIRYTCPVIGNIRSIDKLNITIT